MSTLELIVKELKTLPPAKLKVTAGYIHRLKNGTRAKRMAALRKTAGSLSAEESNELENSFRRKQRENQRPRLVTSCSTSRSSFLISGMIPRWVKSSPKPRHFTCQGRSWRTLLRCLQVGSSRQDLETGTNLPERCRASDSARNDHGIVWPDQITFGCCWNTDS